MKLASKYETKLGLPATKTAAQTKTSEVKVPKSLRKLAATELKFHKKVADHQAQFSKIASGPQVTYSAGALPALYHVCAACQGLGKVAKNLSTPGAKFASAGDYLSHLSVDDCGECKGKRVIKAVDDSQCSEEQLLSYAAEKADKDEKKKEKKAKKVKKKLEKLEGKAKNKKLALDAPEEYAKLKADKKEKKTKKKLEKQAKKADKKVEKFKSKKKNFPFFGKKED